MTTTTTSLGERILLLRRRQNIRQEDLAQAAGVSKAAVSKWEQDQAEPSVMRAARVARVLGVTLHELVDWENVEVDLRERRDRRFVALPGIRGARCDDPSNFQQAA